jgi:CRISPR-associated endonuclease Cas1
MSAMLKTIVTEIPEAPARGVQHIFTREPFDARVVTVHGYGIRVRIADGHLVISDGIGRHRRERRWPKADRTLQRIVITGPDGYISLEALQWCSEHGITVATANPHGELVAHHATSDRAADAKMIRTQALAGTDGPLAVKGIEVATELLTRKLAGQSANLVKLLDNNRAADRITAYAARLDDAESVAALEDVERYAAQVYFAAWAGTVAVPWHARDADRIPSNWITYPGRKNSALAGNTKRQAADPVNAMLNFSYAIGYHEARTACIAHGLHPGLGFMHADKPGRDSLALDVLEALRPEIDAYILGLLGFGSVQRDFTYRDFTEPRGYPPGTVRMVAPLTHEIAEQAMLWQKTASDAAREVVSILAAPAGRRSSKSHVLKMRKAEFQSATVTADDILSAEDWERVSALLPAALTSKHKQDYSSIDNRVVIAAMVYLDRHHKPWAHVPPSLGVSARTLNNRRLTWSRSGHWPDISAVIDDLAARIDRV